MGMRLYKSITNQTHLIKRIRPLNHNILILCLRSCRIYKLYKKMSTLSEAIQLWDSEDDCENVDGCCQKYIYIFNGVKKMKIKE
jgi:hypothetical protein